MVISKKVKKEKINVGALNFKQMDKFKYLSVMIEK